MAAGAFSVVAYIPRDCGVVLMDKTIAASHQFKRIPAEPSSLMTTLAVVTRAHLLWLASILNNSGLDGIRTLPPEHTPPGHFLLVLKCSKMPVISIYS